MKLSGHGEVESAFRSVGEPCHGCCPIGEVYDSMAAIPSEKYMTLMARCHLNGSLVAGIYTSWNGNVEGGCLR